jgi:hypothetical protein
MRGYRVFAIGLLVCAFGMSSGCKSNSSSTRTVVSPEPSISSAAGSDSVIVEGNPPPPVKTVGVVDRHPLFSKPRDYWESSGDNKIVKAAAATFVGVPVGMYGEVKQIIVGAPPATSY